MGFSDERGQQVLTHANVGRCMGCELPFSTEQGKFEFHEVCQCVEEENARGCICPKKYRTITFNDNYCRLCGHNFIL